MARGEELGAAWCSVEGPGGRCLQRCLALSLRGPRLPVWSLLTNYSNYVLHRFMPNALSSEGGSQVLRCHESQVFLAGEGALSAPSLQS